jgi:GNAT superfamily N-acetyltransferase
VATVRAASAADAGAVSALLGELGYPADAADIPARLAALERHPGTMACVAEMDGRVVGVVTGHLIPAIHSGPPVALLTALVVGKDARERGVGRLLVSHTEDWARSLGAAKISVTSALHRDDAHAFYDSLGYDRSGLRFSKPLV